MADVMEAFMRGHGLAQAEAEHEQQMEENKLHQQILKHSIDRLKIEDKVRQRDLQQQTLALLHGQPAADIPGTTQTNLPSTNQAGTATLPNLVSGLLRDRMGADAPAEAVPTSTPAPAAQAAQPVSTRTLNPVTISGIPELGVPDVSVRPQSLEELVRAKIANDMAQPYTLGEGQKRYIGHDVIGEGGAKLHSVGAGGLATADGHVVVPGRPAAPQRPLVVNGQVLDPANPAKVLAVVPPQARSTAAAASGPTQAQRATAERWKAGELKKLEDQFKKSQPVSYDGKGAPILSIDSTGKEVRPMTADDLTKAKQQIQSSYLAQIGASPAKGGAAAATRAPAAAGGAPTAPAGWKYVAKPGGGWTAVPDSPQ